MNAVTNESAKPEPATPRGSPAPLSAPVAGVSIVGYQPPKAGGKRRDPVPAVVVAVAEDGSCSLKLLARAGGAELVERVPYSAKETDEARWFWR